MDPERRDRRRRVGDAAYLVFGTLFVLGLCAFYIWLMLLPRGWE